jgi:polyribonucleotide nucleotidyltransferase
MTVKKTFDEKKFSTIWEWKDLSFETGKLAVQADSSVSVRFEDDVLLFSTVMQKKPKWDLDFLPLMIDFRESFSAAGKLWWAAYRRREWRPSDSNVLYARLVDRALRPMFPKWMINDVVITISPLALDLEYNLW